jgi:hypothetical protein
VYVAVAVPAVGARHYGCRDPRRRLGPPLLELALLKAAKPVLKKLTDFPGTELGVGCYDEEVRGEDFDYG